MAGVKRCSWTGTDPLYERYHDDEWGVPVTDSQALFERLALEGMQAGLSWITVLKKRERMREQFFEFDLPRLAAARDRHLNDWLEDPGLIRHRGKLEAMVSNARIALETPDFSDLLWRFAPPAREATIKDAGVPSETAESLAMSKALKKAGFRFVGPTICYAFMQSVGMVNDHVPGCWRRGPCTRLRRQVAL